MLIHIGSDMMIYTKDIISIFDYETLVNSRSNKAFLMKARNEGKMVGQQETIVSCILTHNGKGKEIIYCSPISSTTLLKRLSNSFDCDPILK